MNKKNKRHSKKIKKAVKVGPSWVLALVAVLAPVLSAGVAPLFAADLVDAPQKLFDFSIFNGEEFLQNRRLRHSAASDITVPVNDTEMPIPFAPVNPCNPTPVPTPSSSEASVEPISISDLSVAERETLRLQLRNRVCPDKADPQYLELCRRMLRALPAAETRTGLTNPHQ